MIPLKLSKLIRKHRKKKKKEKPIWLFFIRVAQLWYQTLKKKFMCLQTHTWTNTLTHTNYKELLIKKNSQYIMWKEAEYILSMLWLLLYKTYIYIWTVVLEKTLESPFNCKEIQLVHPKGNQFWLFIGRTDAEAETPILWQPDAKKWLIGKDPDAVKDRRQEERGDDRGWDGWMASPNQWTWVRASSKSWWWTGKPAMLQSMGLQRVRHDWATELNWTGEGRIGSLEFADVN